MGKKLRESARGQSCNFGLSVCNYDPKTVVLCHAPHPDRGMAFTRECDYWAAYGCSSCHDAIDGRTKWIEPCSKEQAWLSAIYRTQKQMREQGLIQ